MTEDDRVHREEADVATIGAEWARRTDAFLVGYVSQNRPSQFHTPAIVEMQRSQGLQTERMLTLTRRLELLTWALLWIGVVQLLAVALQVIVLLEWWKP